MSFGAGPFASAAFGAQSNTVHFATGASSGSASISVVANKLQYAPNTTIACTATVSVVGKRLQNGSSVVAGDGSTAGSAVGIINTTANAQAQSSNNTGTVVGIGNATSNVSGAEASGSSSAIGITNSTVVSSLNSATVTSTAIKVSGVNFNYQPDKKPSSTATVSATAVTNTAAFSTGFATPTTQPKKLANQRNLSITSYAIAVNLLAITIRRATGSSTAFASQTSYGIKLPFFNPDLYNRSGVVYILESENRAVSVEPEQDRIVYIDEDSYREIKVAA
jgi:hypothetical protein